MIQRHGQVSLCPATYRSIYAETELVKPERRNVKFPAPVAFFLLFFSFFHSQSNNNWNNNNIDSNERNNFVCRVSSIGYFRGFGISKILKLRVNWTSEEIFGTIVVSQYHKEKGVETYWPRVCENSLLKKGRRIHFQQSSTRQEYAWKKEKRVWPRARKRSHSNQAEAKSSRVELLFS